MYGRSHCDPQVAEVARGLRPVAEVGRWGRRCEASRYEGRIDVER